MGNKYLTNEEVKKLSLYKFIEYCKFVNEKIFEYKNSDKEGKETNEFVDQFLFLKGMEDAYILKTLNSLYLDGVTGFTFNFIVECDDGMKSVFKTVRCVKSTISGYGIYDENYDIIPFSKIIEVGAIFGNLMNMAGHFYCINRSIIYNERC